MLSGGPRSLPIPIPSPGCAHLSKPALYQTHCSGNTKDSLGADKMAPQVKGLVAKPNNLSLISGTPMVYGED